MQSIVGSTLRAQNASKRLLPMRVPMVFCTWWKFMYPHPSLSRWFTAAARVEKSLRHERLGQW